MQRFLAILTFYRPYVVWSFCINAIIGFSNPHLMPALITKLFLTIFVWYYVHQTAQYKKLIFYKSLGISTFCLFVVLFLIDCFLTILFLVVFKEFT